MEILAKDNGRDPAGLWVTIPMVATFEHDLEIEAFAKMLNSIKVMDGKSLTKIKCEEIGYNFKTRKYIGLFYYRKDDPAYKRLKKEFGNPKLEG